MNTTPNPRATKKSSGELVGPLLPPLLLLPVGMGDGVADVVDDMAGRRGRRCCLRQRQSLKRQRLNQEPRQDQTRSGAVNERNAKLCRLRLTQLTWISVRCRPVVRCGVVECGLLLLVCESGAGLVVRCPVGECGDCELS